MDDHVLLWHMVLEEHAIQAFLEFAKPFSEAGIDAFIFDYRGFGDSGGIPRQDVSYLRQREDYHAAIAAARGLPNVDETRIAIWGTSYSGGHVLVAAAQDQKISAVISMNPATDGLAALSQICRYGGLKQLTVAVAHGLKRFSLFSFRPKSASYSNCGATGHGGHH